MILPKKKRVKVKITTNKSMKLLWLSEATLISTNLFFPPNKYTVTSKSEIKPNPQKSDPKRQRLNY